MSIGLHGSHGHLGQDEVLTLDDERAAPPLLGVSCIEHSLSERHLDAVAAASKVIGAKLALASLGNSQIGGTPVALNNLDLPASANLAIEANHAALLRVASSQLGRRIGTDGDVVAPAAGVLTAFPDNLFSACTDKSY